MGFYGSMGLTSDAFLVPNDGCLNFVDENDEVLLAGFGRKGKAKGDIPGVRFKGKFIHASKRVMDCVATPAPSLGFLEGFGANSCHSRQGFRCRSPRSLEGEEGEAQILSAGHGGMAKGTVRHEESRGFFYVGICCFPVFGETWRTISWLDVVIKRNQIIET